MSSFNNSGSINNSGRIDNSSRSTTVNNNVCDKKMWEKETYLMIKEWLERHHAKNQNEIAAMKKYFELKGNLSQKNLEIFLKKRPISARKYIERSNSIGGKRKSDSCTDDIEPQRKKRKLGQIDDEGKGSLVTHDSAMESAFDVVQSQKCNHHKNVISEIQREEASKHVDTKDDIGEIITGHALSEMKQTPPRNVTSEQTEKRDKTYLMTLDINNITFTELRSRCSELILAFKEEHNSNKIASSQIKQLQHETDSIKAQLQEVRKNCHNMRLKCNQFEAMYGAVDMKSVDDDTLHKTLALQNELKQTTNELNDCKQQLQSIQNEKEMEIILQTAEISAENKALHDKIYHLEESMKDKDESLTRYKTMNQQLSNALAKLRQHKVQIVPKNRETHDDDDSKEEKAKADETELKLCHRMYRDELQQSMDQCNKEQSASEGENAKLKQQIQQIQHLSESKVYLNDIITKQKLRCSNLTSNTSEQQASLKPESLEWAKRIVEDRQKRHAKRSPSVLYAPTLSGSTAQIILIVIALIGITYSKFAGECQTGLCPLTNQSEINPLDDVDRMDFIDVELNDSDSY